MRHKSKGDQMTKKSITFYLFCLLVMPVLCQAQVTTLSHGGTNQTSWTASRCVHVNAANTALEAVSIDCTPRLDQVLNPTADKTFDMGANFLELSWTSYGVKHTSTGSSFGDGVTDFTWVSNTSTPFNILFQGDGTTSYMYMQPHSIFINPTLTNTQVTNIGSDVIQLIPTFDTAPTDITPAFVSPLESRAYLTGTNLMNDLSYYIGDIAGNGATPVAELTAYRARATLSGVASVGTYYGFRAEKPTTHIPTTTYEIYTNVDSGSGQWAFYGAGTAASHFGGVTDAYRFKSSGTALVAGDFALSAGWGDTPTASISAVVGTDQATAFTVSAGTANFTANPTISLTFKDGTWTNNPVCVVNRGDASAPATGFAFNTTSATVLTITFQGTPQATTYKFNVVCMGR